MLRWGARLRPLQSAKPFRPTRPQQSSYKTTRFGSPRPQYSRFQSAQGFFYRWAAKPTFFRDIALLSGGAGTVYVFNLEEVPVSGRRRFNIISPAFEESVAKRSFNEIKQEYQGQFLPDWDPRVLRVKKVLDRLVPYAYEAGLRDVDWEVHVIDSPEQNAFVIPGGKVFMFTGLLPFCKNEDGIAAVLGHEIAHVVAHHSAESMSRAPIVLMGIAALAVFDVSLYTSTWLLNLFLSWPGSRKQESEADYIGLLMMAQGCYRPEAAIELWDRMEKADQASPPQVLSTHPSHHNRAEQIRQWLPEARAKLDDSECRTTMGYAEQFAAAFRPRRPEW